jgi:hypothetical protein
MDRHLVRHGIQPESLDRLAEEQQVRQPLTHGESCGIRKRVRGSVESDREGLRPRARHVERIAPVSRSGVEHRARERAGDLGDLTDVDVEKTLTDETAHAQMLAPALLLSRGLDRFVRVLHQALRAADRARDVEATVEVPEVLRSLERLLESRLREAQRGSESLEFALVYLRGRHQPQMLPSAA